MRLRYSTSMDKETFQDVMWLYQELGRHLRTVAAIKTSDAGDTRDLVRQVIQYHQNQPYKPIAGRNPFNWLKELQSTLNFWHHLHPESLVAPDDIWRDLDTLERVAIHLGLDADFISNVHEVKERSKVEVEFARMTPGEDELREWIRQEIAQQLRSAVESPRAATPSRESAPAASYDVDQSGSYRGEIADQVRSFVIETYIDPARAENQKQVRVKAGDVDKALGFRYRRLPLICSALRAQKFLDTARVKLIGEEGPPSGASTTTTFLFEFEPKPK